MAPLTGPRTVSPRGTPFAVEAVEYPVAAWAAVEIQVQQLTALARAVGGDAGGSGCACETGACRWSHLPGGARACALATDLAAQAPPSASIGTLVPERPGLETPGPDTEQRYLEILAGIAPAVYLCRRMLHAGDRCWFDVSGPASSLCGRVLAAAHGLQVRRPASDQ